MRFITPIFDVKNLSLAISHQAILKNITFQIFKGDYVAIIGPNGGGKTTLIRVLLSLEKPTSGEIKLYNKKLSTFKEWNKIGFVPQRTSLIDTSFPASVEEIVSLGCLGKKDKDAIEEAMSKMDITHLRDKMIGKLSGGQRQRAMIARALASKPEILILDEPNTGVDRESQQRFYALLRELNQKDGITIVFITHDVGVIADDVTRVFTINQRATICNNPKELLSCDDMSQLYGIEAHLLHRHKHGH